MRIKNIICLLDFLLMICVITVSYGQIPPVMDDNWKLNLSKSDEFNDLTFDISIWDKINPSAGIGFNWGGGQRFRPANVLVDGNNLILKAERCNSVIYSGGVQSVNHNYSYGYYEIRAQLPGYYKNGTPCGYGFWPAFWTYYQNKVNGCVVIHDEIDILEPSGSQYANANVNVCGWHDEIDCRTYKVGQKQYTNARPLFSRFHKYAVEWLPDRIIFYFDDKPFYENYNQPGMVMSPQYVVIDFQIDERHMPYDDTPWPQYMIVDYFKYYELNCDFCDDDIFIMNVHQFYNTSDVWKNITIGDGINTISLLNDSSKTLRASNSITINNGFYVPLGTELNLIPTPCNY